MYKDEFTDLVIKGLKAGIPSVLKEYGDEDIYIISIEADNTSGFDEEYSFTLYVNTEENYKRKINDPDEDGDEWYYRFCEYEWYVIPDPDYFGEAVTFLNDGYATIPNDEAYECIVNAVEKLRRENFFESVCPHDIFVSINASELFEPEDMKNFIIRMNGKEKSKDYVENTDSFL